MLDTLAQVFRPTPTPTGSTLDRIADELATLPASLARARTAYSTACLDVADGVPGATDRMQEAEAERLRLDKRFDELQAARSAATERDQTAARYAISAETARRWRVSVALAEAMEQYLVKRLASDIQRVSRSYKTALEMREKLAASMPRKFDEHHPLLHRADWEARMQREFARCGLEWTYPTPWGTTGLPTLESEAAGARAVVRSWADRAAQLED